MMDELEPILFLDVDGVLNSYEQLAESKKLRGMAPFHVAQLARVLRETGAKIVVSSVWRHEVGFDGSTNPVSRFHKELEEKGADGLLVLSRVISRTEDLWQEAPDSRNVRGFEIQSWLEKHQHSGPFAIVDDDSDMGELMPHLVKTSHDHGLTYEKGQELIDMLKNKVHGNGK